MGILLGLTLISNLQPLRGQEIAPLAGIKCLGCEVMEEASASISNIVLVLESTSTFPPMSSSSLFKMMFSSSSCFPSPPSSSLSSSQPSLRVSTPSYSLLGSPIISIRRGSSLYHHPILVSHQHGCSLVVACPHFVHIPCQNDSGME